MFPPWLLICYFSGSPGYAYVQILHQVDICASIDVLKIGSDWTRLLTDHLTSTCMSVSEDPQMGATVLKVLPGHDNRFKIHFITHVAGKGFSCSPVSGIAVFIQRSCGDKTNCPNVLRCVSLRGYQMTGLTVCKFQCETKEAWAPSQYKDRLIYVWRFPC